MKYLFIKFTIVSIFNDKLLPLIGTNIKITVLFGKKFCGCLPFFLTSPSRPRNGFKTLFGVEI